jgi:hypothetical protein
MPVQDPVIHERIQQFRLTLSAFLRFKARGFEFSRIRSILERIVTSHNIFQHVNVEV